MQPNISAGLRVTALVSVGKHPSSGRGRRADQDARAVEIGLSLNPELLEVLHAGDVNEPSLRDYSGMGLKSMRILKQDKSSDVVPALSEYLSGESPDIILTGVRSESGESSGMLPYLLGEKLGLPVVSGVAEITSVGDQFAELLQALPRGQRRSIRVPLPFIASVDSAAKAARQSAFGPAKRADLVAEDRGINILDQEMAEWSVSPAKKRPKRLKVVKAKTAADRFKAATAKASGDGGKVLRDESAAEKAKAIFDLLLEEGVIR
jgi:electron transfer flavoprotein beta subunit